MKHVAPSELEIETDIDTCVRQWRAKERAKNETMEMIVNAILVTMGVGLVGAAVAVLTF